MQPIFKLLKSSTLAFICAPLVIIIVATAASFFIPVGTYLPEARYNGRESPKISVFQSIENWYSTLTYNWLHIGESEVKTARN